MSTILRQLPNNFYTAGLGVVHFFPLLDENNPGVYGPGVRLGDVDSFKFTVNTEKSERKSKEHDIITKVLERVTEISVDVELTVMQLSPEVRAASIMGSVGKHNQDALVGVVHNFGDVEPGVYRLPDYATLNAVATKDSLPAAHGVDWIIDPASGMVQVLTQMTDFEVTYDRAAISGAFISGIGSSNGLRGMLMFRGTNKNGVKTQIYLNDVQLSASGGRSLIAAGNDAEGVDLSGIAAPVSGVAGIPAGYEIGYETDVPDV